ncbi:MAG: hypothetical protein ABJG41_17110 [Cyclobacteriaceae bacterium]
MTQYINWAQEYQDIRDGVIKEMKDLINNKILIENPSWAKYLTTDKRDDISSKINSVLASIYSKIQSNAMGQSTYSKTGDYFKNHIYDAFFKRSPKNAIHEDLIFFMEVTLPEIREKELKKYQSESSEYQSKFFNDPEFLKSEDLNVMKHLIRTEVIERVISAREFDVELDLAISHPNLEVNNTLQSEENYSSDSDKKENALGGLGLILQKSVESETAYSGIEKKSQNNPTSGIEVLKPEIHYISDLFTDKNVWSKVFTFLNGKVLYGKVNEPVLSNYVNASRDLHWVMDYLYEHNYFIIWGRTKRDKMTNFVNSLSSGLIKEYSISASRIEHGSKHKPKKFDPEQFKMVVA